MIANDRFERDLQAWLESEASTAPVGLHDAAIDRARGSRQRAGWLVAVRGARPGAPFVVLAQPRLRIAYLAFIALIVTVIVAAIAAGAFRSDPSRPGRNGLIVYSVWDNSERTQRMHAHLMNADGTGDRAIGPGSCPTFSRDGTVIVYVSTLFGAPDINVAGPDGTSGRVVSATGDQLDGDFAVSADGSRIAWLKQPPSSPDSSLRELWVSPASGGPGVRTVPIPPDNDATFASPAWSPDGRKIAFVTRFIDADGGSHRSAISIVSADGSDLRTLTTRATSGMTFSWSPDGRYIAYDGLPDGSAPAASADDVNGPRDIFVIDADGTEDRDITNSATDESGPQWSPDGMHLAYQTDLDQLATVKMDGPIAIGSPIPGPAAEGFVWSPDGTMLLLRQTLAPLDPSDAEASRTAIETVDADFRGPIATLRVVDFAVVCSPSWQRLEP